MKRNIVLLVAILSCGLWACHDDEIVGPDAGRAQLISLSGEIDQLSLSRVSDGGFCNNDVMGVYIVDYAGGTAGALLDEGNRATNLQFTFDEPNYKWNSAYDVYWKDGKTPIDVYGYYPYGSPESVGAYAFEVRKDQSKMSENGVMGGYEASDFLWGKAENVAPQTPVVRLSLRHKMSNARVTLVEGEGFSEGEWIGLEKQVLVTNTKRKSQIDLATGVVSAVGEVASTGTIPFKKDGEFRAIVVPQGVAAGTKMFTITVDGAVYTFSKEEDFTYVPSKMHNFTIKVNKKEAAGKYEFLLISESITPWEDDLFSHNALAKEYVVIESEGGKLKECIKAANKDYRNLVNLKITGNINVDDFYFMRDSMDRLQALNLKEVRVVGLMNDEAYDNIPSMAFYRKMSLQSIVLPDNLKYIGVNAFEECKSLSGSLIIPEGVIIIEAGAFWGCTGLRGTLSLPTTLERIEDNAFGQCTFTCELILPGNLKYRGSGAFNGCSNLYGSLVLPDKLEELGSSAFGHCLNLTGNLVIPQGIKEIKDYTFGFSGFNGMLTLHDGITYIGEYAFSSNPFKGELTLPRDLAIISNAAFSSCNFSGELKLPANLIGIGDFAFSGNLRLTGMLEIPDKVQSIGREAFIGCGIQEIILPVGLESIAQNAFINCYNVGSIVCKGSIPPYVQSGAFDGVPKDNFTLEVPEAAIDQYKTAQGWNEFKRIAAHRELVCRPSMAMALNKEKTYSLILYAEGDWEVESIPDWCELSQVYGSRKTELTLTIKEMAQGSTTREGDIVFRLKDFDYTTKCHVTQYDYEHGEDEVITLQEHTKGKGVNLVILGDGFNAEDISSGNYLRIMNEQMDRFFDIEPYRTYREYFNVYTAVALSLESGIGTVNTIRYTKFGTTFTGGVGIKGNSGVIFGYTLDMPTVTTNNLNQTLIIMVPNSKDYGGITEMWEDGSAIAFCPLSSDNYPYDSRGILQHEAGGHGFGKLGDEYIYHNAFIDFCDCMCCGHVDAIKNAKSLGWYENLSLTGKTHEVPWSHLIFDKRYSGFVDIYEGGFMHTRGVFRSEQNSCMNNNISYYSTISREAIVKRIMRYAGESYSFEEFVKNDKRNEETVSRSADRSNSVIRRGHQQPPRIHKGSPSILK